MRCMARGNVGGLECSHVHWAQELADGVDVLGIEAPPPYYACHRCRAEVFALSEVLVSTRAAHPTRVLAVPLRQRNLPRVSTHGSDVEHCHHHCDAAASDTT